MSTQGPQVPGYEGLTPLQQERFNALMADLSGWPDDLRAARDERKAENKGWMCGEDVADVVGLWVKAHVS